MERPELSNYKDEIHHTNGFIEERWNHNDYVDDLNRYVDYLEAKFNNVDLANVSNHVCVCTKTTQLNKINDSWVCTECNRPIKK